jgi:hypothetical protein
MPSTRRDQHSNGRSYDCPQRSKNGFTEVGKEIESASLAVIDSRANGQTAASADQQSDQRISPAPPSPLQLDPSDFRERERLLACGRVDGERIWAIPPEFDMISTHWRSGASRRFGW